MSEDTKQFLNELSLFIDSAEKKEPGWLERETKKSIAEQDARKAEEARKATAAAPAKKDALDAANDEMTRRWERSAAVNKRLKELDVLIGESNAAVEKFIADVEAYNSSDEDADLHKAADRSLRTAIDKSDAAVKYGEAALRDLADPKDANWPEQKELIQKLTDAQRGLGESLRKKLG